MLGIWGKFSYGTPTFGLKILSYFWQSFALVIRTVYTQSHSKFYQKQTTAEESRGTQARKRNKNVFF